MNSARPHSKSSLVELAYAMKQMAQSLETSSQALEQTLDEQSNVNRKLTKEIEERKKAERRLATHHNITRILANAETFQEATSIVLETVCQQLGWSFGALWKVNGDSHRLRCVETWTHSSTTLKKFEEKTKEMTFAKGIGLPGRVWESENAAWINEISKDENFPRSAMAIKEGFAGTFAFPIRVGDRVQGVMEFFSSQPEEPDEILLEMMSAVGAQIGMFWERKRTEEKMQLAEVKLKQMQKMEAIGNLAGGIAHDFNNGLTAILGFTELALRNYASREKVRSNLEDVFKSSCRAKDLVQQILAFSRQNEPERKPVNLLLLTKEVLKMLRATLPSTITVVEDLAHGSGKILGDPTEIHQILMNLCTNADFAMRGRHGTLKVGLVSCEIGVEFAKRHPPLSPGSYLRLEVRDTGTGIDPKNLYHIFDPFFTTKPVGEGTGMGLSVVHGHVKNNGGAIFVESQLGEGTTFIVFFPMLTADDFADMDQELSREVPTGTGRILFVDDEEPLTRLGRILLEDLGYEVIAERNPVKALETFRASPESFDAVITDQTMPIMTGEELSRKLLDRRPDVPIILCSGYSHTMNKEKAERLGIRAYIMKPFLRGQLAQLLHDILLTAHAKA